MTHVVLLNAGAGSAKGDVSDVVRRRFAERGVPADVRDIGCGEDPRRAAARAAAEQPQAIVAGGGDGTLNAVAEAVVGRSIAFGILPLGTLNHFAKDLGIPLEIEAAIDVVCDGRTRDVDVGRVNGRLFLNNLSLGLYADLVHPREHHRRRGDVFAGLRALERVMRDHRRLRVQLDGEVFQTRVVLVANNAYDLRLFNIGARPSLSEGRLHLYTARGLLPARWHERDATRFVVSLDERRVIGATDGEPVELEPPLEIECLPRALRVLGPARPNS